MIRYPNENVNVTKNVWVFCNYLENIQDRHDKVVNYIS